MAPDEADPRSFIEGYVRELTAAGAIRSPRVERAFRTVERHRLLAAELDRLYQEWVARGRPAIGDYQVTFLPAGVACDLPAGGWQVERRFHRELLTTGPSMPGPASP